MDTTEHMNYRQFRKISANPQALDNPKKSQKTGNSGIRKKTVSMNKTETLYAYRLQLLKLSGQIQGYYFETLKLKLGNDTWYCPDFLIERLDWGIELHETKGTFTHDDAKVKFKVAVEAFPCFIFVW